jgi:hypothetical protein
MNSIIKHSAFYDATILFLLEIESYFEKKMALHVQNERENNIRAISN